MPPRRAIDLALDLARMPSLSGIMREQTLPNDILEVIRIAAGCSETSKLRVAEIGLPLATIRAAATLYLQEMLFYPDAGPYRNLGVSAGATRTQMRMHMRWLLQWLHPDHNSDETAALLAERVISAWREFGRKDRLQRAASSGYRRPAVPQQSPARRSPMRVRWIAVPLETAPPLRRRGRRAVICVLAAAAAAALILIPDAVFFGWLSLPGTEVPAASLATEGGSGVALVDSKHK